MNVFTTGIRFFATGRTLAPKVALLGASGGIGQPLGLLLKGNDKVGRLALYDIVVGTEGVCADLSHIDTTAQVTSHVGTDKLSSALEGADIVVIPAGVPRKPGMTRDDLFNTNAGIVRDLCTMTSQICPKALLALITNPINSTVPIASEIYKKQGVYDPKRIFGVTTLDIVRSQTFVAEQKKFDVKNTTVTVIGGHSGVTIIPLLSRVEPSVQFTEQETKTLTERIQDAGTEVVKAKAGAVSFRGQSRAIVVTMPGSATLSMAFAGARFVDVLIRALLGGKMSTCAYIRSDVVKGVDYFSSPITIGPQGVESNLGPGELNDFERKLLNEAIPELQKNIEKGVKFAQ